MIDASLVEAHLLAFLDNIVVINLFANDARGAASTVKLETHSQLEATDYACSFRQTYIVRDAHGLTKDNETNTTKLQEERQRKGRKLTLDTHRPSDSGFQGAIKATVA